MTTRTQSWAYETHNRLVFGSFQSTRNDICSKGQVVGEKKGKRNTVNHTHAHDGESIGLSTSVPSPSPERRTHRKTFAINFLAHTRLIQARVKRSRLRAKKDKRSERKPPSFSIFIQTVLLTVASALCRPERRQCLALTSMLT